MTNIKRTLALIILALFSVPLMGAEVQPGAEKTMDSRNIETGSQIQHKGYSEEGEGLALIPWPKSLETRKGSLRLRDNARIVATDESLQPLAEVLADDLLKAGGVRLSTETGPARRGDIVLKLDRELRDEAYALDITDSVEVLAGTPQAAAWATATLLQALSVDEDGAPSLPQLTVRDEPDYSLRRIKLHTRMNYRSVEDIKSYIALGRLYKAHAELGFIVNYPGTIEARRARYKGTDPERYSREQMEELRSFARPRGVELAADFPFGKAPYQSFLLSYYPELEKAAKAEAEANNTLIIDTKAFWQAVDRHYAFIAEHYDSPYVGLGETAEAAGIGQGDHKEQIKAVMEKYNLRGRGDWHRWFLNRSAEHARAAGLTPMLWCGYDTVPDSEAAFNLPKDMVMMFYSSRWGKAQPFADAGYPMLNSSWNPYYIVGPDRSSQRKVYEHNPRDFNGYVVPQGANVLGAQLAVWEDTPGRVAFDALRVRVPAMGERLWTEDIDRGYEDFARRYEATDTLLERLVYGMSIEEEGLTPVEYLHADGQHYWYADQLNICLSTRIPGAEIRYTYTHHATRWRQPEKPTKDSTLYSGPIQFDGNAKRPRIRARVFGPDGTPLGLEYAATYEWHPILAEATGLLDEPRFTVGGDDPRPNTFRDSMTLKLHAPYLERTGKGTLRVTLDGSTPDTDSPAYEGPITITEPTQVQARLFDENGEVLGEWSMRYTDRGFQSSLTTGARATAKRGGPLGYPIDGMLKKGHHWDGGRCPTWYQVEWDEPQTLNKAQVIFYWDGKRYYQYKIETSLDGEDWRTVVDASNNRKVSTKDGFTHTFEPVEAKYLRVTILKNSANPSGHIVALHAFGPEE